MKDYGQIILNELEAVNKNMKKENNDRFIALLEQASHIFLTGAGRSGLIIKTFANRLIHLGYDADVVGEVTTPHTQKNDVLIINSGSGETTSLKAQAQIAKENGLRIILITSNKESTIGKMSDLVLEIPVQSKLSLEKTSIQPMGSLFEQYSMILFDSLVLDMMHFKNETSNTMYARHANLE